MKSIESDSPHVILGSLRLGIINDVEGSALEGILGSLRRSVASRLLNSSSLYSKHLGNNERKEKTHHGLDEVLHFGRHVNLEGENGRGTGCGEVKTRNGHGTGEERERVIVDGILQREREEVNSESVRGPQIS